MNRLFVSLLAMSAWIAPLASATVVVVPLSSAASSVDVTFCLSSHCDSDTSPLTGSITLDLDSINSPTQATLLDFVTNVSEPIDLFIQLGPGSTLTATTANVVFLSATPGIPNGPVPIVSGDATFSNVLSAMQGTLTYNASGIACVLLTNQGYACSDNIDLSTLDPANADQVITTISSVNRTVSVSTRITVATPLDPNNPALGDVMVDALLVGSVFVPLPPCPADLDGDHTIALGDLAMLLANYGLLNATPAQGDLDGDQTVSLSDLAMMLAQYGTPCPS